MKRIPMMLLTLALLACHGPTARAKESPAMREADQLFTAGRYDAALQKYDAVLGHAADERTHTRALFRAVECETLLYRHEQALDRVRAARLPADVGMRAVVQLGRLEMLRTLQSWYGFSDETEEGAKGSARLSRAAAEREMEAAAAGLWQERAELARLPLSELGDFFVLKDVDLGRYPSLWDFVVLRLGEWLAEKPGRAPPASFAAESFPRRFDAGQPNLVRLGALYEESGHLDGGSVDRGMAGERWRVARVMLGRQAGGTAKEKKAWHDAAVARLEGWARSLHTALGRGDAAWQAATLLADDQRVAALRLIDAVLPKTPESEVAVGLRQLRHTIVAPQLSLSTHTTRAGKHAVSLTTRNLGTVWLRLYRVDPARDAGTEFWSNALAAPRYDHVEAWLGQRKPAAAWKVKTGDAGDHKDLKRELDVPAPGVGLYLVVASGDAEFLPRHSMLRAAFANVTDLAVARTESADGVRWYAFDVDHGAPAAGVPFRIQVSTDWRSKSSDEVKAGSDGVASWRWPQAPYAQVDALAVRGRAVALFGSPLYHGRARPEPPLTLFLVSDRPIYRPGQQAQVRVTSIARGHDGSYKIDGHRKLALELRDPNGKAVGHAAVTTDAMGSAATTFTLPDKGLLGAFSVVATAPGVADVQGWLSLRVEEYKRPEFEVTLEAPKGAARYGQKTRLSGKVQYYFGGAAAEVPVRFKVSRRRWIPWWYWRRGESPTVEIARGDVKTDAAGRFTVEFVAAPDPEREPSEDPELPDVSDFIVEVEAHDAGGRTIQAERSLRVGAQAVLLSAAGEHGFYLSNEQPRLEVRATNLEEQPVAVAVAWDVERLGAPKELPAEGPPLQGLLARYPTAQAHVAHGTVQLDGKSPAKLTLPALPAGGYRVRLTQPGGDGRGSFVFLVADARTRALALPLPPITLVRKDELQPGDEADLLVGASAASGTYHVELWRGNELVEHRVEHGAPVRVIAVPVGAREAGGFSARWIGVAGVEALGGETQVRVPRKDKNLTVALVNKPASLEPGQAARWTVQIKDQKGRPVAGEALVTIYDRSLELYAKERGGWADSLWAPPPPPPARAAGVLTGWGTSLPPDEAAEARIAREIQGQYKPHQLPRFSWERTMGYGGVRHFAMGRTAAAPGAEAMPAAPPMAQPVGGAVATRRAEATAEVGDAMDKDNAGGERKAPPPPAPALRTNMAETAAFVPDLRLGADGRGTFHFKAPERLTSWRVQIYALGRAVEAGVGADTFATKKPLMVRVEIPRFFREGDRSTVTAVVHNETDAPLAATVDLDIVDDATHHSGLAALGVGDKQQHVEVPAHGLAPVAFPIVAPENIATYEIRAHVAAGSLSDAEERPLPILPSRERLVQSRVVALRGDDQQRITFDELAHPKDPSLRSESMTVSIDPELALSVLRSIPFLVEYPYECVEQTLNRYVPLAIVNEIYKKHPELAKAIAAAPHRETEHEPWNKDDPRRMLQLQETPWLVDAQGGARDGRLRDLLNPKLVSSLREESLGKLTRAQNGSGAFPWFPGGQDDFYMTLYVLEQLAMLQEFGITPPHDVVARALAYVARKMPEHRKRAEADVAFLAYGSYVVTAFDPRAYPEAARLRDDVQRWMKYVLANKQILTPYGRAWCARVEARLGDKPTAMALLESALDGAKTDPVVGVYWTPERYSWLWYSDTVEKHAFFLRTLAELKPNDARIPGMLQWLLFNRKGNEWHSTKASAAAVYSILDLMQKQGSLSRPERFDVVWDKQEEIVTVKPTEDRRKPLSWTVRGREVTPARGTVELGKKGPGIAFASATWIYSSTRLQAAHASNLVSLERKYFRKVHQADGDHLVPLASGDKVRVGEEIEVRLYVKTKSQFEYVHIKEPRGAGFEETTLTSGWRWDKLPVYEEPRDSLFNFFVSWLPHGELELRHSLRPTTPGKYRIGSAVLQSMYSPDVTAYSSGIELEVVK